MRFAIFAVTPLVLAPLALLALLLPALFAGPLAFVRRWWVLFNVASVSTTLYTARFIFRGVKQRMDQSDLWWASPAAFWSTLSVVAALGTFWAWRRHRRAAAIPPAWQLRLGEEIALGLLSFVGVVMVIHGLWSGLPLLHPALVIWSVMWAGTLYAWYLRRARHRLAAAKPILTTQGVMLGTLTLACAAYMPASLRDETVSWEFVGFDRGSMRAAPLVVGDRVYVAACLNHGRLPHGDLYCLHQATGLRVWTYPLSNEGEVKPLLASPCFAEGRLYVGDGRPGDVDCNLYCLDAASGRKLWQFQIKGHAATTPCVVEGKVLLAAGAEGIYCLDAVSGNQVWHFNAAQVDASPVAADQRLYAGGRFGESHELFSLGTRTGRALWRTPVDKPVTGEVVAAGAQLFFTLGDRQIGQAGALLCLEPGTGRLCWRHDVSEGRLSRPVLGADHIYFAAADSHCYCLNRQDGELRWRHNLGSDVLGAPALAGEKIYVAAGGEVHCLRADTGDGQGSWSLRRHSQARPRLFSPLVVYDGYIYFGTAVDDLLGGPAPMTYCLKEPFRDR